MTYTKTLQDSKKLNNSLLGSGSTFDLSLALASLLMIIGVFIDGWAHSNLPETEETFFTPWHAILYSGFFASAAVISFVIFYNYTMTTDLSVSIPDGYTYSFIGVIIFLTGGVGDMLWHTLIGIETDIEALFSPTHLMLMLGAFLIASGMLRKATLDRSKLTDFKSQIALTLSAIGAISIIIFFTQFAHPYRSEFVSLPNAVGDTSYTRDGVAFMGFIWQSALLMLFTFYLIDKFNLSAPLMGLFISVPLILASIMEPTFYLIPGALIAGILVGILYGQIRGTESTLTMRLFGGLVPLIVFGTYYINMAVTKDIGWSLDLWTGSLVVVTLIGILVSFVFYPIKPKSDIQH